MIARTFVTVALVAAAGIALAQTAPSPQGGATMPRDQAPTTPQQDRGQMTSPTSPLAEEGLAKSRLEAAGYTGIKLLKRNTDGTWSGKAMRNNQEIAVSIDAQGKVTSQ